MARIRSVHPSLFTDEAWVSCSPLARVLYIGLMTDADDQGLFEWKPLQIRMRLLPGDNADVPTLLAELVSANLIAELQSGGKKLGAIRKFRKFQRPKKPNATFVLPPEWGTYVGLDDTSSEPDDDEGPPVPPKPEIAPQMEDGGGVGIGSSETNVSSLSADKPARASASSKRSPESPIPDGYPDAEAVAEAEERVATARKALNVADHAKRFRNHALTNDRRVRDWPAAWRGWIDIEIEKALDAQPPQEAAPEFAWPGPAKIREVVAAKMLEPWTKAWLDPCEWDEDGAAIIAPRDFTVTKLEQNVKRELAQAGVQQVRVKGRAA